VAEFGGEKLFTPALVPSRECQRACSFVSGEAASTFVAFYAAALVIPRWSLLLVAAGTVGGLATGLIRVSQGAHFLSDVIFAGVFMAATVLIVHRLMFGPGLDLLRPLRTLPARVRGR
jgi:lipid A 4'-phosphatase